MPAAIVAELLFTVIGELIARVGAEKAHAVGRTWFDKKALELLDDDARQAFIAALMFVAAYDAVLEPGELGEIKRRVKSLGIDETGEDFEIAVAARQEVGDAATEDEAAFVAGLIERIGDERMHEALIRVSIAVARKGDFARQRAAIELLSDSIGWKRSKLEIRIAIENQRLIT